MKRFILRSLIGLIVVFSVISISSCSTIIAWQEVKLDVDKPPRTQIHHLRNETVGYDIELQRQIEDIMGKYFGARSEEWGYYTVEFTYGIESTVSGAFLAGFSGGTLFILNLIGMPWTTWDYRLHAYLRFFDSQGNLVEIFQNSKHFTLVQGFYYGTPTRKAGEIYSELLQDLLMQADRDTKMINAILEAAGPITAQNAAAARSKVRASE
ncbi:hypothetical protein ACYULU_10275 [Breznakiellaceae bacterium SP9]